MAVQLKAAPAGDKFSETNLLASLRYEAIFTEACHYTQIFLSALYSLEIASYLNDDGR